jgi:hypothetical protein
MILLCSLLSQYSSWTNPYSSSSDHCRRSSRTSSSSSSFQQTVSKKLCL